MIVFLFGKAGCGKSYLGRLAAERHGVHFYDADQDLTERFKAAIQHQRKVTDDIRDEYIETIIATTNALSQIHSHVCVSQALVREKYRRRILDAVPGVRLVWVDAPEDLITARLRARSGHLTSSSYAEMVNRAFEPPEIAHVRLINGDDPAGTASELAALFARR